MCFHLQCFMNSILQCLSNTPDLRDYCLANVHRLDLNNDCATNATLMEGRTSADEIRAADLDRSKLTLLQLLGPNRS